MEAQHEQQQLSNPLDYPAESVDYVWTYAIRSDMSEPARRPLSRRRSLPGSDGSEPTGAESPEHVPPLKRQKGDSFSSPPQETTSTAAASQFGTLISRAFAHSITPRQGNCQYGPSHDSVLSAHFEMEAMSHSQHQFPTTAPYRHGKERSRIISWMEDVAESLDIAKDVVHQASFQLDRIMHSTKVPKTKRGLVAACCLLLTCKYEGVRTHVPYSCTIQRLAVMSNETSTSLLEMEALILNRLQWNLVVVSPCHFVDAFLTQGVVFEGDVYRGPTSRLESLQDTLYGYCRFFVDLCLKEYGFRHYKPSTVASAIIWASRRTAHISPTWPPELEAMTKNDHTCPKFKACCNYLWKLQNGDMDPESPDSVEHI